MTDVTMEVRINIALPEELHKQLKRTAADQALTLKDLIIEILQAGVKRYV